MDTVLLTIGYDRLEQLYFQNPKFGMYFLVAHHCALFDNIRRMKDGIVQRDRQIAPLMIFRSAAVERATLKQLLLCGNRYRLLWPAGAGDDEGKSNRREEEHQADRRRHHQDEVEAAAFVQESDGRERHSRHDEDEETAHGIDAPAPGIRGVARQHDMSLTSSPARRRLPWQTARATSSIGPVATTAQAAPANSSSVTATNSTCGANHSTNRPTASWAMPPTTNTAVAILPTATSEMPCPARSSMIFGNATVMTLNAMPAPSAMMMNRPNTMKVALRLNRTSGLDLRAALAMAVVLDQPQIGNAAQDADRPRHEEGRAPPEIIGNEGGDAGRQRDAHIAAHPIESERTAARLRCLDQHRHPNGMIDRSKHAERTERDAERDQSRRQPGREQRCAAAKPEHRHHVASGSSDRQASRPAARRCRKRKAAVESAISSP